MGETLIGRRLDPIKIYLDLDGVLADFGKEMDKITNNYRVPQKEYDKMVSAMSFTDFFYRLPKMAEADELLAFLDSLDQPIELLTACGGYNTHHVSIMKKAWCFDYKLHFPFNYTKHGVGKAAYAEPNTILIDDHYINTDAFTLAGGHGILYKGLTDAFKEEVHEAIKQASNGQGPNS